MPITLAHLTNANTLSVTIPATTAGNTLIVCIGSQQATAQGSVTGVTLGGVADNFASAGADAHGTTAGNEFVDTSIWIDANCAGGQTAIVVSGSNLNVGTGNGLITVYEVAGLGASPSVDAKSSGNGNSAAYSSGGAGPTTVAAEFWAGCANSWHAITVAGAPWTDSGAGVGFSASGYQITTATGTATYSGTCVSGIWAASVVTIKPTAAAGVSGTVQPRVTVPVPRRRPARGIWGGVQGQAFVQVPAPVQQFRTAPRRRLARALWRGGAGQAFVFVPAPKQAPYLPPRRRLARAFVQFTPVRTTNAAGITPPSGSVQPRATIPLPRRRPGRAVWAGITGQAFVAVPAPRQQPKPAPRRTPARAYVRFTPVQTVNAAPAPAGAGRPVQVIDTESRLIRRYRHMLSRHGLDDAWEPEVSLLAAPVAVEVPPGWPGTWPVQPEPEPEPVHVPPVESAPALLGIPALPPMLAGLAEHRWPGVWPGPLPELPPPPPPPPKWRPVYTRPPKIVRSRQVSRGAMMPVWRKTG